jgi:hypothetical protein
MTKIVYPAKSFSDLFESVVFAKEQAPKAVRIHPDVPGCELSSYCSVNGGNGSFYYFYVKPKPEVIKAVEDNSIGVDYDQMYFQIVIRDKNEALVCAKNNKIIGGPWLSLIDPKSIPPDPDPDEE